MARLFMNTTYLSENFTLQELLHSPTATRSGFDEQFAPPPEVIENLKKLCVKVLQPLRDRVGVPISITSGYRCERVNKAIGGSLNSHHLSGYAADAELILNGRELNLFLLQEFLRLSLPFTQAIAEFGESIHNMAWLHLSYDENNLKKQILRAEKVNGNTVYSPLKEVEVMLL